MGNIEAIGLGALNTDNIYRVERILEDGEALAEKAGTFPGGSAANTIYGLAMLGVKTGFIGAVGDDGEGKLMVQDFRKVGVDTGQIAAKKGETTGSTLCLIDSLGRRSIYVAPGVSQTLTVENVNLTYIEQARILHISSLAGESQLWLLKDLAAELTPSVKLCFSPGELYARKGTEALAAIISRTLVLFLNQNEMKQLTGREYAAGAEMCLEYGCQVVVVTLGEGKGLNGVCYIRDDNGEYVIADAGPKDAVVADTTGAGDAFASGFLYGMLRGKGLEECGRLGGITARFSIGKTGAREGLPTLPRLAQRYLELYHQRL